MKAILQLNAEGNLFIKTTFMNIIFFNRVEILAFKQDYCLMDKLRRITPAEILIQTACEDKGEKRDPYIQECHNCKDYLIICLN
jgi:hypothetical protein